MAEHAVIEVIDYGIEHQLIRIHLIFVVIDVEGLTCAIYSHVSLHEFKNSGQVTEEEDAHADIFVKDENAVSHLRLYDTVKCFGLLRISSGALETAHKDKCIDADPFKGRVKNAG